MGILYCIYSAALWFWTYYSVADVTAEQKVNYVMLVAALIGIGFLAAIFWGRNKHILTGIYLALILANLGGSIAYRTSAEFMKGYLEDLIYMTIAFAAVYIVIRYTRIYRWSVLNVICAWILPFIPIVARLTSIKESGAYLNIGGLQIFGVVLAGYAFVSSYFLSFPEKSYLWGNVGTVSVNLIGLLAYTFLLFIGCALCNELGLLLVLALTASVLFFVRCKNLLPKIAYSAVCLLGAGLVALLASHVRDRLQIWLHLKTISGNEFLEMKAETVLYLFRNFQRTGWYGNGIGNLSKAIYTTLNSDHALVTLFHDYGALAAVLTLVISILLVKYFLFEREELPIYDRYLNLSSALMVGFILLIHIASNLGSFITAGVGFPWVSDGGTTNLMFTVFLAVHCGLNGKKGGELDEDDEDF